MKKYSLCLLLCILFLANYSFASVSRVQDKNTKKYYILLNGFKKGPFSFATRPYFSKKDKSKWVYVYSTQGEPVHYSRNQIKDRKQYVQSNSKRFGPFDEVYWRSIEYSPSKNFLYFVARKGKNRFIFINGKKYGPFSEVKHRFYFYNQDKIWAVVVVKHSGYFSGHRIGGKQSVLINGKSYGKFKLLNSWDISPDFKTLLVHKAYIRGSYKSYRFKIR